MLDSRARTMIRSPVKGRVKYLLTLSVSCHSGALVLEILPDAGALIVEAKLPVNEKAYVSVGQNAKIRLSAPGPAGLEVSTVM